MKTKGITVWERYVEKMVVGVAGVAFVVFGALQFIGEPNAVQIGTDTFAPADVDETLQSEAERLEARINWRGSSVELPDPIPALGSLTDGVAASISPRVSLAPVQWQIVPDVYDHLPVGGVRFTELQVPAPTPIRYSSFTDTLDPSVVIDHPDLTGLFPSPSGPYDLTWVTATVWFPLAELIEQLRGQGDVANDDVPFPSSWSPKPHPPIVDVVFERQKLVDGAWSNQITLEPIPGQVNFRDLLAGPIDAAAHDRIMSGTTDKASLHDLIQPGFYQTVNSTWAPLLNPDEIVLDEDDEQNEELQGLVRNLKKANGDLARYSQELEDAGGPLRGDEGDPGRDGSGGGRGDPPGRGGGRAPPGGGIGGMNQGGDRTPGRRNQGDELNIRTRRNLMNKIDELERRIEDLQAQVGKLRPDLAEQAKQADQMLDGDLIPMWAHDLHVEAGAVYRYRAIVKIFNPAFGRKRSLVEEQQALADVFAVESFPSAWSSEVEVKSRLQVYITDATPAGAGAGIGTRGLGQATAEVYRFRDGRWWRKTYVVQPGDHIGGLDNQRVGENRQDVIPIDFSTGYYVLDVIKDLDASGDDPLNARSGATVVLQNAATGERTQIRQPASETRDSNRLDLYDTVRARQVASKG